MSVLNLNADNFEQEVLKSDVPVLVDFWAPWCGPCKVIGPILEEIAAENADFKVGKINVDNNQELAQKYGVMSIPTLIVVKGGEEVSRSVGGKSKEAIVALVK